MWFDILTKRYTRVVHMRGEMNSNRYEISFRLKTSVLSQLFTCVHMNWCEMKLKTAWISYRSFWPKWNFISGDEISYKHYPKWNIGSFWNVTKMKLRVNTPGWNLKPVWVYFAFHVNVLLMLPKVTTSMFGELRLHRWHVLAQTIN